MQRWISELLRAKTVRFFLPFLVGIALVVFACVAPLQIAGVTLDPGAMKWVLLGTGFVCLLFSFFESRLQQCRPAKTSTPAAPAAVPPQIRTVPAVVQEESEEALKNRIRTALAAHRTLNLIQLLAALHVALGDMPATRRVQGAIGSMLSAGAIAPNPRLPGHFHLVEAAYSSDEGVHRILR